jgi:hypothetical protein
VRYRAGMRTAGRAVRAAAVLLTLGLLSGCGRAGGEAFQPTVNAALPLDEGRTLGQSFRPATEGVAGVDLLMATFGAVPDPDGQLAVVLRDATSGRVLARSSVPGTAIGDNTWASARFDPPAAAPAVAAIELTWDGGGRVGLWANVPPPDPGPDRLLNDPYPGGELLVDGEHAAGDLAFRVVGTRGATGVPRALAGVAAGALRGLGDRPLFAAVWALLLAAAVVLAVAGFRHGRPDEQAGQDNEARLQEPRRAPGEVR